MFGRKRREINAGEIPGNENDLQRLVDEIVRDGIDGLDVHDMTISEIKYVARELLANACQAGSRIQVDCGCDEKDQIAISIRNNGRGLNDDNPNRGAGIGLSEVRRIVRRSGGSFRIGEDDDGWVEAKALFWRD
jgi:signal transduction histidine kinase